MNPYGLPEQTAEGLVPARVISQEKGVYRVAARQGEKPAEITGKLRYRARSASEYPAVGDVVAVDWNEGGSAVIHDILPRKSCFLRKAAGAGQGEQVVAANIDTVFLCMSLNRDFNLRRLERYLAAAWESGASPVIVLTKMDLCDEIEEKRLAVSSVAMGVDILWVTAAKPDGYAQLRPYLGEGRTVAFIGSSGTGKSTMINRLLGEERLETNGLRNDDRGRHTTTHRELFLLPGGGMVIDTPRYAGAGHVGCGGGHRPGLRRHRGADRPVPLPGLLPRLRAGLRRAAGAGGGAAFPSALAVLSKAAQRKRLRRGQPQLLRGQGAQIQGDCQIQ